MTVADTFRLSEHDLYLFREGTHRRLYDLNRYRYYRQEPALHELDFDDTGFERTDRRNADASVISFVRRARSPNAATVLVVCNFTPVLHTNYVVGVARAGHWHETLNSNALPYGGDGSGNLGSLDAAPVPAHGKFQSLTLTLPPLATLFFTSAERGGSR